uniref:Lipoyltransferase and lipoate-protein ligase n=1 Tax=Eubacterium plexicaudatum ASF492 TaxID=1235802 RepID=N2AIC6_9FIRM
MYKYVIGTSNDPYYNLAFEETLFQFTDEETIIFYLWQNENTIVVGKNQDVYTECRADEFMKNKGVIARRKSGGGAVYHDLGNLCFSIISRKSQVQLCDYRNLICRALIEFGIHAEYNGRNDLVIGEKKFSGNAVRDDGKIVCQHGTILINTSIKTMNRYLTPDVKKLERNGVRSVVSRVMNLSEISDNITVKDFGHACIDVFQMQQLSVEIDMEDVLVRMNKYADTEWIFGRKMI